MANCKSAGFLVPKGNPFDYGMRNIKMQERLRTVSVSYLFVRSCLLVEEVIRVGAKNHDYPSRA